MWKWCQVLGIQFKEGLSEEISFYRRDAKELARWKRERGGEGQIMVQRKKTVCVKALNRKTPGRLKKLTLASVGRAWSQRTRASGEPGQCGPVVHVNL